MLKRRLINFLKFLGFLSLGVAILYLVYSKQAAAYLKDCALKGKTAEECGTLLQKVLTDFSHANYGWIFTVLLAFTVSNVSRAIRWNMLLKPLGSKPRLINSFLTVILGYFANLGLPRIGEVVRAGALARYENIPVEKVMGTVVTDRIVDVISIFIVTGLAFLLEYDRIWQLFTDNVDLGARFGGAGNLLLLLAGIGVFFLALLWLLRKRLMRTSLYKKVRDLALGFWQGIKTIRSLDRPWLFLFHSVNIWLMYYAMTYLCFFAFEPTSHLSPMAGLVVFVFGGWGIVIPSPGGMGTYHWLAQTALGMYGISGDDGFSWANISFFSIQLGCNISIGLLAYFGLPWINRHYVPESARGVRAVKAEEGALTLKNQ